MCFVSVFVCVCVCVCDFDVSDVSAQTQFRCLMICSHMLVTRTDSDVLERFKNKTIIIIIISP